MDAFTNCQQLKTVRTVADEKGVTVAYIYRLLKEEKLKGVKIDGVQFVVPEESK